jgi:hypothetical protein
MLAGKLIRRIMDADAKCEPSTDVELRLYSIISERDALAARLAEAERLITLAEGIALTGTGVPALPMALRERMQR